LPAGEYNLVVTDGVGCVKSNTFIIGEPEEIDASISAEHISIAGTTGTAVVSPSGGVQPYIITCSSGNVTDNVISELSSGIHQVIVIDSNGCKKLFEFEIYDVTAVRDIYKSNCLPFPNPVQEHLRIVDCELPPIFSYSIFDSKGVLMNHIQHQPVTSTIDTANLPSGVYFLRIQTESTPVSMPFVKTNY
jgi:hypothetical protein